MNKFAIYSLKTAQKLWLKTAGNRELPMVDCIKDIELSCKILTQALESPEPCMIARFGAFELNTLVNYLGVKSGPQPIFKYINGASRDWWWNDRLIGYLHTNAGFFPPTYEAVEKFCIQMLEDSEQLDILGSWLPEENYLDLQLRTVKKLHIQQLEPFWSATPWTKALENKKVLVVHPFAEQIQSQYKKKELLFNKFILPNFELKTIKALQTAAGEKSQFIDWFSALDYMKTKIDEIDYDICLIGAGAYGFPLAAHVKKSGKKAVHLGGALQLLFGIKGKRWENPDYGVQAWGIPQNSYVNLMNEHWVRPSSINKPSNAEKVEGACYW